MAAGHWGAVPRWVRSAKRRPALSSFSKDPGTAVGFGFTTDAARFPLASFCRPAIGFVILPGHRAVPVGFVQPGCGRPLGSFRQGGRRFPVGVRSAMRPAIGFVPPRRRSFLGFVPPTTAETPSGSFRETAAGSLGSFRQDAGNAYWRRSAKTSGDPGWPSVLCCQLPGEVVISLMCLGSRAQAPDRPGHGSAHRLRARKHGHVAHCTIFKDAPFIQSPVILSSVLYSVAHSGNRLPGQRRAQSRLLTLALHRGRDG